MRAMTPAMLRMSRSAAAAVARSRRRGLATSVAAAADADSLIGYGERVLRAADPRDKVALTAECKARWDAGELRVFSGDRWTSSPPAQPARSAEPELLPPKRMPSGKQLQQRASIPVVMLHALAHIELGAIDNYWDTLVRFDPEVHALPRAFYDDFLTVASDEARHFRMVDDRLRELDARYGCLPATRALLEHASNTAADLAARIAVVPLVQEARGLDSGDRLVHKLQSIGDRASAAVVKQIVWEERSHVRCGIKWFHHIARVQGRQADPIAYFHELVLQFFPDGLPGPFNVEARLASDMDASWYQPLESKARSYPSIPEATPPTSLSGIQAFVTQPAAGETSQASRMAAFAASKKKVVFAGSVWPERTSSAAGVRSADLISILQAQGFHVLCVSPSRLNEHTERLRDESNVECIQADANSDAFQKLLLETSPQVVVFDRFIAEEMYGWQAKKYAPEALRVLDLQDVHFLRKAREHLVKKQGRDVSSVLAAGYDVSMEPVEKQVIRELASIHRSDLTLFVSDFEREMLVNRFQIPDSLLHRCDFFYPTADASQTPSFADRQHIAFIGSFKHSPNVDAVEWTRSSILPLFRSLQPAGSPPPEVHVYGSYGAASRFVKMDDPARGFRMKGFAPDVHETLRSYRLTIAPLRFGAGIKGKIADSWFAGTPCVSTGIGSEGMTRGGGSQWGGSIANTPEQLAAAMHELYHDPQRWADAQRAGVALCNSLYSREANAESFLSRLDDAMRRKTDDRARNWTGAILWSERYRATEYMSRYIRAKNDMGRS